MTIHYYTVLKKKSIFTVSDFISPLKTLTPPTHPKWLTENPEPSSAETYHGTLLKICSSPFPNSRTLLTSKSQPTEKPAGHEDSASSNSTPPKNASKLWQPLKALRLTDEKLFSPKVNHEKLKAVAEAVTAADEVADEAVTVAVEVVTTVDNPTTAAETGETKKL